MTEDLTPTMDNPAATTEITQPSTLATSSTAQPVGGFMASPSGLQSGQLTLNATNEQILLGAASAPNSGVGVFMGNAGDGTYDFRVGDPASVYLWWDESAGTLTVVGTITITAGGAIGGFSVGSDYIRDAANSMGLASTVTAGDDVRFWAGDTFANRATAPFHVTESGAAYFTNIRMGGASVQYVINDNGYFSYGDGSDGSLTTSGDVTLTTDKYYTDLTISTGNTFNPAGYRVFVSGTLTINGTGKISGDGIAGGAGTNAGGAGSYTANAGGAAGNALADGYLKGSLAGVSGGSGTTTTGTAGSAGSNKQNSIGANATNGANGGAGGNGATGSGSTSGAAGGTGGAGGTVTASNVRLIANWHLATMLDISSTGSTVKFDNSASAGSGAGGGGSGLGPFINPYQGRQCAGGGGGGSGSSGRIVAIYARNIVIGASASITAKGGNGGNGGTGGAGENAGGVSASGGSGGGGGGAGGNGGVIVLIYNTLTNNGTISVAGGTGGTGGTGGASGGGTSQSGTTGSNGTAGATGSIYEFQLSF
jgi:hypothetical protein